MSVECCLEISAIRSWDDAKDYAWDWMSSYSTAKTVKIKNSTIGLVSLFGKFLILVYISSWVMWHERKYLSFESPVGLTHLYVEDPCNPLTKDLYCTSPKKGHPEDCMSGKCEFPQHFRCSEHHYCAQKDTPKSDYNAEKNGVLPCRYWDHNSIVWPPSENSALTIASRASLINQRMVDVVKLKKAGKDTKAADRSEKARAKDAKEAKVQEASEAKKTAAQKKKEKEDAAHEDTNTRPKEMVAEDGFVTGSEWDPLEQQSESDSWTDEEAEQAKGRRLLSAAQSYDDSIQVWAEDDEAEADEADSTDEGGILLCDKDCEAAAEGRSNENVENGLVENLVMVKPSPEHAADGMKLCKNQLDAKCQWYPPIKMADAPHGYKDIHGYVGDFENFTVVISHSMWGPESDVRKNSASMEGWLMKCKEGKDCHKDKNWYRYKHLPLTGKDDRLQMKELLNVITPADMEGVKSSEPGINLDDVSDACPEKCNNKKLTYRYKGFIVTAHIDYDNTGTDIDSSDLDTPQYTIRLYHISDSAYQVQVLQRGSNSGYGANHRSVHVLAGPRFIFQAGGKLGWFDVQDFMLVLITMIGMFGMSSILVDWFMLSCFMSQAKDYEEITTIDSEKAIAKKKAQGKLPSDPPSASTANDLENSLMSKLKKSSPGPEAGAEAGAEAEAGAHI